MVQTTEIANSTEAEYCFSPIFLFMPHHDRPHIIMPVTNLDWLASIGAYYVN